MKKQFMEDRIREQKKIAAKMAEEEKARQEQAKPRRVYTDEEIYTLAVRIDILTALLEEVNSHPDTPPVELFEKHTQEAMAQWKEAHEAAE